MRFSLDVLVMLVFFLFFLLDSEKKEKEKKKKKKKTKQSKITENSKKNKPFTTAVVDTLYIVPGEETAVENGVRRRTEAPIARSRRCLPVHRKTCNCGRGRHTAAGGCRAGRNR